MNLARIQKQLLFLGLLWALPFAISEVSAQSASEQVVPTGEILKLSHSQSHNVARYGDVIYLNFLIENKSDMISRNISVQFSFPENTILEAYSQDQGEFDEDKGVWQLSKLKSKESASLSFNLLMNSNQDIDYQAFIKIKEGAETKISPSIVQGSIKWAKEDCLIVFNDFSQTGKGKNRGLYVDCLTKYPNNFLQVFDRWGAIVYEKENYDNSWTGKRHTKFTKFGREKLDKGTYYYVLSFPESDKADKYGSIYISE
ncbi:MAG: gliding motility-associated C-terminal domain-containing protein [Eudoraea sp.]|nr:gliding motility-associated C-terminal domain-containing protein [Eudoraea sp.]